MSSNTALILRDPESPPPHVLECDGPKSFATVNRYPGEYRGKILSFDEYAALPDHAKFPRDPALWEINHNNIRRIYRLIEAAHRADGFLYLAQIREIRARLKLIDAFCDEDF